MLKLRASSPINALGGLNVVVTWGLGAEADDQGPQDRQPVAVTKVRQAPPVKTAS